MLHCRDCWLGSRESLALSYGGYLLYGQITRVTPVKTNTCLIYEIWGVSDILIDR